MKNENAQVAKKADVKALTCGLIMPISSIDGCSAEHWLEVKSIFTEAVESISAPQFSVKLVSEADEVGVIQKRIVQNVYNSDIIVCDVSCKNPNVMFELGMRLAFDRPTVIVKDDKTEYSFDTGVIEHLTYPRDLRFGRMVSFKSQLSDKVLATYKAAAENDDHSTFLKNFGTFKVASLKQSEVPADMAVLEILNDVQRELMALRRSEKRRNESPTASLEKLRRRVEAVASDFRVRHPSAGISTDNAEFMNQLDIQCNPSAYFTTPHEFRRFVDDILIPF